jgi:hypothetical protein
LQMTSHNYFFLLKCTLAIAFDYIASNSMTRTMTLK